MLVPFFKGVGLVRSCFSVIAQRRRFLFSVAGVAILAASGASIPVRAASAVRATTLSDADFADLKRIEAYLDKIHTLEARFSQTTADGAVADGRVWLSRPGKMRFEYAPPQQLTIISNGDFVAVDDQELKNVSFYPVESTPIWFLLRAGIQLSGDVTITKFERGPKTLRVTAVQTKDPGSGAITLVFTDQPLELHQWQIIDGQNRITTVALSNPQEGVALSAELFRLPENKGTAESKGSR